jgi:hypothetical protein
MEQTDGAERKRPSAVTVRPANVERWADKSDKEKKAIVDALFEGLSKPAS